MRDAQEHNSKKLKDAAIALIKEHGYSNVTVNQICNLAGVSRSSFYSMFSTKDDLIIHIYTVELTKSEDLIEQFALKRNDYERICFLYNYYVSLAISVGPDMSSAMMIIELNRNIGIYDAMKKIRKWLIPLCENCQEQGIILNKADAKQLISMVSAALNHFVYEWCRSKGDYPLREQAQSALEVLLQVNPEYKLKAEQKE